LTRDDWVKERLLFMDRISLLIPTLNRSEFVVRALKYYAQVGFQGCIHIGDSSDEAHQAKIQVALQSVAGQLQVHYSHLPRAAYPNDACCLQALLEKVSTPYAVYSGDDDFLIPKTLEKCTDFLEAHSDYSAVNGISVAVTLAGPGAYGEMTAAHYVGAHHLESSRATERWRGYVHQAISTQYYLHRTETWRRMYQDVSKVPSRYLGPEFLPCSLSAILGKIKEIEGLSCVFQINPSKHFGWQTHSLYALMMGSDWSLSVRTLRESLISALAAQDGLELAEAQAVFDREFWWHLNFMLQWHYQLHHAEPLNVYDLLKRRRALVNAYLWLKNLFAPRHRPLNLRRLLQPRHPLHADFMPIYKLITSPA